MHSINFQITILNVYKVFYTKREAFFIYTYRPMNNEMMELVVNNLGFGTGKWLLKKLRVKTTGDS